MSEKFSTAEGKPPCIVFMTMYAPRLWIRSGLLLLLTSLALWAGASKPKASLQIHLQITGDATPGGHTANIALTDPDETIAISALAELTERDLESIEPVKGDGSMGAVLKFNRRGKLLLNTMTSQGQGRIMVVFLNGRMAYAPVIDMPIGNGTLVIPRGVTPQEVEMLQHVIKQNQSR